MTRLTNKQRSQLESVLYHLKRAYDYLERPEIAGIATVVEAGHENGGTYRIINPACIDPKHNSPEFLCPTNKNIGSDMAGLSFAYSGLKNFLEVTK